MGRQVNFFMLPEDELAFLSAIRAKSDYALIRSSSKEPGLSYVELPLPKVESSSALDFLLIRPEDADAVRTNLVGAQHLYCVDVLNSPVVQWKRSRMMPGWLASGRLWFENTTTSGLKPESFCRWANSLLRWLVRNYKPLDQRPYLVAPVAGELSGVGELQLGPPPQGLSPDEMRRRLGLENS